MSAGRSLRILRVVTDLYPEVPGGGAMHAHLMSARQAEMGHEVTVLTSDHGDRSLPRVEDRDGYTLRRYQQVAKPFGSSITPGMVRGLLGHDADVVHAHSHLYFSTNLAAAVSRFTDAPLVVTNHGLFSQTAPKWVQRLYLPTVARPTLNAADCVLCYTDTDRDRLRERGVSTRIDVVPNGIDCSTFRPMPEVEDTEQVLFVGRLKRVKGPHRLLEAMVELVSQFPSATLKLVGEGPLRPELERMAERSGIDDRVTFAGHVPNADLPRIYNESAVFALPSTNEGLPRTVLESLSCGTPVVTSDLPQLEPVVEEAGLTVPAESVDGLADALAGLLGDSTRREEMGAVGRRRVVQDHSWKRTVSETTAVYSELIRSRE